MQQHKIDVDTKYEEEILEAIDQLRKRKARPDADRICNYLLRKFSVDARDTIEDLHRLIEKEKVIQVDYKGNTSYRNASKWSRLQLYKNRPEGFVKEKLNSAMIASAVSELVVEEPDYLDQGVPANKLIEHLLDGVTNPTSRKMVEDFLSKEVANGNITKLSNGNYSLVDTNDTTNNSTSSSSSDNSINHQSEQHFNNTTTTTTNNNKQKQMNNLNETKVNINGSCSNDNKTNSSLVKSPETNNRNSNNRSLEEYLRKLERDIAVEYEYSVLNIGEMEIIRKTESHHYDNKTQPNNNINHVKMENGNSTKEIINNVNPRKSSKTERKQRLMVRADDSMDIEIKFDEYLSQEKEFKKNKKKELESQHLSEEKEDEDAERSSTNPSPTLSNSTVGGFRSARRKRAKKVFDPSDNNIKKRRRGKKSNRIRNAIRIAANADRQLSLSKSSNVKFNKRCSLCSKDKQEILIPCRDCTVKAHPSCIYNSTDDLSDKSKTSWQCNHCKSCCICCETSETGPLAICTKCNEAFHYSCHEPRITSVKSPSKWQCSNCTQKQLSLKLNNNHNANSIMNPSAFPPVLSPQVSPSRDADNHTDDDTTPREKIDPNIPDASDWTSEQVYQYFARLFPKEAEVFRVQDIDGHSLLLMKRSDVLIGLNLLLGPALKIYRHVIKLQMRRDDTRNYWL